MSTKLFVGNLSFSTTDQDLQNEFANAGLVESASVIKDRETGRSRGFAFVVMSSEEEAQKAIEMFHGKEIDGRTLNVNIAREKEQN
jgi:RNA recognition motif-containing protein